MIGYTTRDMGATKLEAMRQHIRSIMMAYPREPQRSKAVHAFAERAGMLPSEADKLLLEIQFEPGMRPLP